MQEVIPILIGMVAGLLCPRFPSARLQAGAAAILALAGAVLAVSINGEWGLAPFVAPIDLAFVSGGLLSALFCRAAASRRLARATPHTLGS